MSSSATDFDVEDFPEMDVGDVDSSKIGSHINVDKPGKYHFQISGVRPRPERVSERGDPRRPDILITCDVLESVPGQSGKGAIYFHSLAVGGKGGAAPEDWVKESFSNFLCGIGVLVIRDGVVIDPETGGPQVNMKTICQRIQATQQFIGDIKLNKSDDPKYSDKYELTFGRGAFQVDDPAVASVPKNAAALKLIGKENAAPAATANGGNGKASGKGTGKKPDPAPHTSSAESAIDTSDL